MKRVGLVAIAVIMVTMLSAAFTVDTSSSNIAVSMNTATAASTCPSPKTADPLNEENCFVCTILPVLNSQGKGRCPVGQYEVPNDQNGGAIVAYLKLFLQLLSFLIGAIILLVMVIAGVQYITSAGDPARVKSAKGRVVNAITALILYLMMFAILNFLIPGGILT